MDGEEDSLTPRKALWRSASWSGRSSQVPPSRPPKPSRPLQPLCISRNNSITGWPCPASDDSGHPPPTPSSSSAAPAKDDEVECSLVTDHVYIGSEVAARDRELLLRHGITHVLNCVGGACPDYFRGELFYKTLWLHDSPAEDITSVFYDAFDYLEEVRTAHPPARVLVHCRRGASRSATLVIAYLMWRHSQPFDEALRDVRAAHAAADPNLGFASQLLQCQTRVLLSPSTSGVRAYRMAPHSPYDPLHLVPKLISFPNRFDSRGAFLLHVPSAVFVWLGLSCDLTMAEAAATAARQVVRYEHARGPILTVCEGSEPPEFWASLPSSAEEEENKEANVGKRRVELYDFDFEIFRRALVGEVVPSNPLPVTTSDSRVPVREEANEEEYVDANSTTPSSLSAETTSSISTFSPASTSSSDGYGSSPSPSPESELDKAQPTLNFASKLPPLHPRKKDLNSSMTASSQTLAGRRSGSAPSLVSLLPSDERHSSPGEIVRDWCLSPLASEMGICGKELEFDSLRLGSAEVEENVSNFDFNLLNDPLLFQWPKMDKVEIHRQALDSNSVFMLFAPDSSSCRGRPRKNVLYVCLRKKSNQIGHGTRSESNKEDGEDLIADWDKITAEFLGQMGFPVDISVQIVKEGEEPEQFLNNLFSSIKL